MASPGQQLALAGGFVEGAPAAERLVHFPVVLAASDSVLGVVGAVVPVVADLCAAASVALALGAVALGVDVLLVAELPDLARYVAAVPVAVRL